MEREPAAKAPTLAVIPDVEPSEPANAGPFRFEDVAPAAGIDFTYQRGESGNFLPVEPVGGGAGWIDYDLDGWLDLVLVDGAQLPVDPARRFVATRLYRNRDGTAFEDVTIPAGIVCHDYGQGCSVGDIDSDGDLDLYITNHGRSAMYRNQADGTFVEVTDVLGVGGGEWNTGASFADFDRDGDVDLYVANYFHFKVEGYRSCTSSKGNPEYCGPSDAPPLQDFLYRNRGDGTFDDSSGSFGTPIPKGASFGGVAGDFTNDGWPDLYVANDAGANFLYLNQGEHAAEPGIRFVEAGHAMGVAVNADGLMQASMGIACGDIDGNGWLDIGLSHFIFEYSTLYLNRGSRGFVDATHRLGFAGPTLNVMGWGMGFVDLDNDGWLDIYHATGHLNRIGASSQPYEMRSQLFRSVGGKRFVEVGASAGAYFNSASVARGSALADYDHDGRVDIAVVHHHAPAALLRNTTDCPPGVTIELVGRISNRDGFNARVLLDDGAEEDKSQPRFLELVSGDNYLSANGTRLYLGTNSRALAARIVWPSGIEQPLGNRIPGSHVLAIEGNAIVDRRAGVR